MIMVGNKLQDMQDEFYGNLNRIDPRRKPEQKDRALLRENQQAIANLPEKGFQIPFPEDYKPGYLKQ